MKYGNIIYFYHINTIGGIETWFYNISRLFNDLDITFVFRSGSMPQLQRYAEKVRVLQWNGRDRLECVNLFCNFNLDIIPFVTAEKKYIVLHGDYEDMIRRRQLTYESLPISDQVDGYIGITQLVCDAWERVTGIKPVLCYNPVLPVEKSRVIRLCSAQRMTREKGRGRIEALASALDRLCAYTGDKWLWDIYTDDSNAIFNENIHYLHPRLDAPSLYGAYDWFVALSDNEGFCYSVVEALMRGVPCVVTDLPVFREIGLDESNSVKLDLNIKNLDFVAFQVMNKKLKFTYKPPETNWRFLFADIKSNYQYKEEERMVHKVMALDTYQRLKVKDAVLDKILPVGYPFEVDDHRLKVLLGDNKYKVPFVQLMTKPETIEEKVVEEEPVVEEKVEETPVEVKEEVKPKRRKKK